MPKICNQHQAMSSFSNGARRRPRTAMPAKYRNRPASIRHAIYLAWEQMDAIGISIAGVAVLQAIIASGVDANDPFKWIYARKETLAERAGVSESSVYRTLSTLERKGFIVRSEQQQRVDGSLAMTQLSITASLADLLGFVIDVVETVVGNKNDDDSNHKQAGVEGALTVSPPNLTVQSPIQPEQPSLSAGLTDDLTDGMRDAAYIGQQKVDRRDEPKPKASVDNQSTGEAFERIGKYRVPVALVWTISEKRLTCPQLFSLMKQAKKVPGQKIEDYVQLRKDRLKELASANDCYRYLSKLISDNVDAKFLAAQQQKQTHRENRCAQAKKAGELRYAWLRARDGQTFIDPKSKQSYTINATHGLVHVGLNGCPDRRMPSTKVTGRFVELVTKGALVQHVPDTDDRIKDAPQARIQQLRDILKGGSSASRAGLEAR